MELMPASLVMTDMTKGCCNTKVCSSLL